MTRLFTTIVVVTELSYAWLNEMGEIVLSGGATRIYEKREMR